MGFWFYNLLSNLCIGDFKMKKIFRKLLIILYVANCKLSINLGRTRILGRMSGTKINQENENE